MLFSFFIFSSCSDDEVEVSDNYKINAYIKRIMKDEAWYLWYEQVPEIDPNTYWNPSDYLYAMINKEIDKWSYVTSKAAYELHYVAGEYIGHGFGRKWDEEGRLRVSFVYEGSPMALAGVSRGWKILEINNKSVYQITNYNLWGSIFGANEAGTTNHFKMENLAGEIIEFEVQKAVVEEKSVLYSQVIDLNAKKVGHIVLKTFIEPTIAELDATFATFAAEGVTDIILDLRYNGGGRVDVAQHLAGLIARNQSGNLLAKLQLNETKTDNNQEVLIETVANSISAEKLVVLASKGTASASELIINGLKPYIDVKIVGDDTYGKPVGMYSFEYIETMIVPICFRFINADGDTDFFDGISANAYVIDDVSKQFSDITEACLAEALFYIENGTFSGVSKKTTARPVKYARGLEEEIGAN